MRYFAHSSIIHSGLNPMLPQIFYSKSSKNWCLNWKASLYSNQRHLYLHKFTKSTVRRYHIRLNVLRKILNVKIFQKSDIITQYNCINISVIGESKETDKVFSCIWQKCYYSVISKENVLSLFMKLCEIDFVLLCFYPIVYLAWD